MRRIGIYLMIAVMAVALAPAFAGAGCSKKASNTEVAEMGDCCKKSMASGGHPCCGEKAAEVAKNTVHTTGCSKTDAKAAMLASNAEQGCAKSKAALIALAKDSGMEGAAELAAKAEGGCEKSTAGLIAYAKNLGHPTADEPSLNVLATRAKTGCSKSAAQLIAQAGKAGCPKTAELAAKAEGGCEKSKGELIAMYSDKEEKTADASH